MRKMIFAALLATAALASGQAMATQVNITQRVSKLWRQRRPRRSAETMCKWPLSLRG
ncbi:MAG: hypothetical protein RLZZ604_1275 [Pseudomonadota bacterium]